MIRCGYAIPMFPPNLKQIGQETRPQWPKNRQNWRYDVITSQRRYVMALFFKWFDATMQYPCFHQIWSKSVKKHGHSGRKTVKIDVINVLVVAWDLLCMYVGLQFARARRSWLCVLFSGPNIFGQVIMPLRLAILRCHEWQGDVIKPEFERGDSRCSNVWMMSDLYAVKKPNPLLRP